MAGPTLAANLVAAAKRADDLPESVEALRRGELSFDQLMPIVRNVPSWADGQVVSLAKKLTVSQVRRLVKDTNWDWTPLPTLSAGDTGDTADAALAAGTDPVRAEDSPSEVRDTDRAAPEPDLNRVVYGTGADGRWRMHADLDPDLGLIIERAVDEARDAVLQLDLDGTVRTDHGDRLPDSIARFIVCDGTIDPVLVDNATPVSIGRAQRTIPDRTRRTVLHRDRHTCQVPGCNATRGLDLHHLIHWIDGGRTDTANLLTLCARHHRMHHKHHLGIVGDANLPESLVFTNARGRPIRASGANPHRPDGPPTAIRGRYEHPLGERLESRWVSFNNPNIPPLLRRLHYPDLGHPDTA